MPDPQQGASRRLDFQGKTYEFDPSLTDAQIAEILAKDAKPQRSTAADLGIGAAKSLGRNVIDLAKMNPMQMMTDLALPPQLRSGYVPPEVEQRLKPENTAQKVGGYGADVLSVAVPAGMAVRGARAAKATVGAARVAPEAIVDYLTSLGLKVSPVAPAAATSATAATSSILPKAMQGLSRGVVQASKYGAGYAVADALRRLMMGEK